MTGRDIAFSIGMLQIGVLCVVSLVLSYNCQFNLLQSLYDIFTLLMSILLIDSFGMLFVYYKRIQNNKH